MLTNSCCRTRLRRRSGTPQSQGVKPMSKGRLGKTGGIILGAICIVFGTWGLVFRKRLGITPCQV